MELFQTKLEKYAELAVKVGVNIQKGQTLVINAGLEAADFVRLITKKLMKPAPNMSMSIGTMTPSPE